MMEGTQIPTKMPPSLFADMPIPNHKAMENKKDRKAANMIKRSPLLNIEGSFVCRHKGMDELAAGRV